MAEVLRHRPLGSAGLFRLAVSLAAVVAVPGACTSDFAPAERGEEEALAPPRPGAVRGELVVYTATYDDGTTDDQFYLRVGDAERRLLFDREPSPDFSGGTKVDIWGQAEGEALRVERYELATLPNVDRKQQSLVTSPPARQRSAGGRRPCRGFRSSTRIATIRPAGSGASSGPLDG